MNNIFRDRMTEALLTVQSGMDRLVEENANLADERGVLLCKNDALEREKGRFRNPWKAVYDLCRDLGMPPSAGVFGKGGLDDVLAWIQKNVKSKDDNTKNVFADSLHGFIVQMGKLADK